MPKYLGFMQLESIYSFLTEMFSFSFKVHFYIYGISEQVPAEQ